MVKYMYLSHRLSSMKLQQSHIIPSSQTVSLFAAVITTTSTTL